jgi:hypothetical protein
MKKLLLILAAISTGFYSQAQDILTKKSGEEILVKVVEISPELVKYKRFDNPDGPLISVQKHEVSGIKYQNGMTEKFDSAPVPVKTEKQKPLTFRKNALAVNVLPLILQSFNIIYDHRLASKPEVALSFGTGIWNQNIGFFSRANQEVTLTGAAKFYIQQSDFYASPYLKFRHLGLPQNIYWNQFGGGGTIGARHVFKSGFLIDSFLGLGVYGIKQSNQPQWDEYYFEPAPVDLRLGFALGYAF